MGVNKTMCQCVYISGWLTCINVLNHLFKVQDLTLNFGLYLELIRHKHFYETGFTKALLHLAKEDKNAISSILVNYHCMTKVKATMNQYIE